MDSVCGTTAVPLALNILALVSQVKRRFFSSLTSLYFKTDAAREDSETQVMLALAAKHQIAGVRFLSRRAVAFFMSIAVFTTLARLPGTSIALPDHCPR